MFRSSAFRAALLLLLLGAVLGNPACALANGAWTTYIHMATCNSVLAGRDTVLLGSGEAGIVRYLRSADRFESITRSPDGLASNAVTALTYDRSGRLWAGTAGKGVSRLSANGLNWDLLNAFDGVPSDSITTLRADGDTVWIGTTRGLALWNGSTIAGSVPDVGTPSPFGSNVISGVVVLGDSLIVSTASGVYVARLSEHLAGWTTVTSGLGGNVVAHLASNGTDVFALASYVTYRLNRATSSWDTDTPPSPVHDLRDGYGRVLAATEAGAYALVGTSWVSVGGGPVSDGSASGGLTLGPDPDGVLAASRDGSLYVQGAPWITRTPPGPVSNDLSNIATNGTDLWVNLTGDGVSRFDGTTWTNWKPGCCGHGQHESFINPQSSYTLQFDRSGHLWTSHWEVGIQRINLRASPLYFEDPYPMWVADQDRWVVKADTLSRHSDGWASACDSAGFVYIGGETPSIGVLDPMGIDVYDSTGAHLINWKSSSTGLAANQVRAIAYDKLDDRLWVGFHGHGVSYVSMIRVDSDSNLFNGNDHKRLPRFTALTALASLDVFGIVVHSDSIWVLTATGLHRLRGSDGADMSTLDVLAPPSTYGCVHPLDVAVDGTVWTASGDGVRCFYPGGGHSDFTLANSPLASGEVRSLAIEPRTGVVWMGTAGGITRYDPGYRPPAAPTIASLGLKAYPNPLHMNGLGLSLQIQGNSTGYDGEILDIGGRVVRRFQSAVNGAVIWDGRDGDGEFVRSGIYFVRARGEGQQGTARVVVLR